MQPEESDEIAANDEHEPRAWWWAAHRGLTTAGLVVLAAVVVIVVVVVVPRHQPARAAPVAVTVTNTAASVLPTFAQGTAGGASWSLLVQNVASRSCLPAVVWNGQLADVLFPGTNLAMTPAGAPSVTTGEPSSYSSALSGASFAFFRVPAAVRQLRVDIGGARPLTVTARDVTTCGETFRLAGFGFPSTERVTVTAITSGGSRAPYTLPDTLVHPAPHTPGYLAWQNLGPVQLLGPPKVVASVNADGASWEMSIGISSDGMCFHFTRNGQPVPGISIACNAVAPIAANAPINVLTSRASHGYFLTVANDVELVTATLPGGESVRATPVNVYGVLFAGIFTGDADPIRFTLYRAGGNRIDTVPWEQGPVTRPTPVKAPAPVKSPA
jgi:hypothetical protein